MTTRHWTKPGLSNSNLCWLGSAQLGTTRKNWAGYLHLWDLST